MLGERSSAGQEAERAPRDGLGIPLAPDAESPGGSILAKLVFVAALALFGVVALGAATRDREATGRPRRGRAVAAQAAAVTVASLSTAFSAATTASRASR